jgi:four helix bundle protein
LKGQRNGEKEFTYFVNIARGSGAEIEYQLEFARDFKYVCQDDYDELAKGYQSVGRMLTRLDQKLLANGHEP